MTLFECGLRSAREIRRRLLPGSLILVFLATLLIAAKWDRAGAESALNEARSLRAEIARSSAPSRDQYLQCARKYGSVHVKDPHYSRCPDAIYEEGTLYEEMGDRFGVLDDYRHAARLFRLLSEDYGGNRFCPDALLRLGDLYTGPLDDQEAAQRAYQHLRSQYSNSKAATTLAAEGKSTKKTSKARSQDQRVPGQAAAAQSPGPPHTSAGQQSGSAMVQNLRYWTTSYYTRVVIDVDGETRFHRTHLSDPERIYFDISNARLSHDLLNRKFRISDDFLKQVRVAQHGADMVRVVLDLAQVSDYSIFELHDPYRIVIDINGPKASTSRPSRMKPRSDVLSTVSKRPASSRSEEPTSRSEIVEARPATTAAKIEPTSQPGRSEDRALTAAKEMPNALQPRMANPSTPAPKAEPVSPRKSSGDKDLAAQKPAGSPAVSGETKSAPPVPATSRNPENQKVAAADVTPPAVLAHEPAVPAKPAAPTSQGDRTLTRVLGLKIGRIVLDPGHGGHDTGTIGPGGLVEKDLVLRLARDLRRLIEEKLGAEVVLTRNDDTFISLEERTAIANQHQADLFVSIHANSSSVRSTSGVETYYLDFARTASEREVAARENATTVGNIRDLETFIKKIAQADKSAESRELAAIVQRKLYSGAQKLFPAARNRGVRRAPFVVLIGANMPSVLAEVAFISNPRDESLLKKENNRERLALALFAGIEGYMKTLGSDVAQNTPGYK